MKTFTKAVGEAISNLFPYFGQQYFLPSIIFIQTNSLNLGKTRNFVLSSCKNT